MVKKYRKIPVIQEGIQLLNTSKSIYDVNCFIEGIEKLDNTSSRMASDKWDDYLDIVDKQGGIFLKTLESDGQTQKASFGDYIMKGIKGEFYPVKPHVFSHIFEEVK